MATGERTTAKSPPQPTTTSAPPTTSSPSPTAPATTRPTVTSTKTTTRTTTSTTITTSTKTTTTTSTTTAKTTIPTTTVKKTTTTPTTTVTKTTTPPTTTTTITTTLPKTTSTEASTTETSSPEVPYPSTVIRDSQAWIWKQQGWTIAGERRGDQLGATVALSADGSTLAAGSIWDQDEGLDDMSSYVHVYSRDNGGPSWERIGRLHKGDAQGGHFGGGCLSLSADGMALAWGAPYNENQSGEVKVYHRAGSGFGWVKVGETFEAEEGDDSLGASCSLSADGTILAIGVPTCEGPGYAKVYRMEVDEVDSVWRQLGQSIEGESDCDHFGISASLSADGHVVAIGNMDPEGGDVDQGLVKAYYLDGKDGDASWKQLGQDMEGERGDHFGLSLSLSADGTVLAIGAPGGWKGAPHRWDNDDRPGYVKVYHLEGDGIFYRWKQDGDTITGEEDVDNSGISVSLSADGRTVAIGANGNINHGSSLSGHVRVYRIEDHWDDWRQLGQDIDAKEEGGGCGNAVSLSADGRTLAVGSAWSNANGDESGNVRVFVLERRAV